MSKLKVSGIVQDSITDGPGLRFALFLQGCEHCCEGCHNPHTWDKDGGTQMTADDIFKMITSNPLLSGVTFSGGEPFLQAQALIPLAKSIKNAGLELAIYTGYLFEDLFSQNEYSAALAELADIIVDGPFIAAQKSLAVKFKGSHNQRIINVPKSLSEKKTVLETDERWV